MEFYKKSPCENCPYRKDAPVQLWHISEFIQLKEEADKQFGKVFLCHKKDGHICVGYLMKQDEQRIPNINLRMLLSKHKVHFSYLDSLTCKTGMYETIDEMIRANYPEIFEKKEKESE